MSQLAGCVSSAAESSIRLVRDLSRPTTSSNTESDQARRQSTDLLRAACTTPVDETGADITVTTSLEVTSASPLSTESKNMASKCPTNHADAPNVPVNPTEQSIRMSKSAAALKNRTPQPVPASNLEQGRRSTTDPSIGMADAGNLHRGAKHVFSERKSILPEFRQSRRWAKFQAAQAKAEKQQSEEPTQPSTVRESSFEQQRAQPNSSLQSPRSIPRSATTALSETDSILQAHGLCRSLSVPTWQVLRTARVPRPTSVPAKWVARKLSIRRHRRTTSRQSENKSSMDLTACPRMAQLRRRLRPRKAVADLRRKAGFASSTTKLADAEKVVDLNTPIGAHPREERPSSPVPSLHDPEKAKRFSQECEALLSNLDFDKDWLGTAGKPVPDPTPAPGATQVSEPPRPTTSHIAPTATSNSETEDPQQSHAPEPAAEARRIPETLHGVIAPEPPERTSSKGGPRLASIVHMSRPTCIPALVSLADGGESSSTIRPSQPTTIETPTRQSSTMSKHFHKGPRPVASTDTLTMIEAQVQDSAHAAIVEKLKQKTAFIVGSHRRTNTATSMPPERPLPSLPPPSVEAAPEQSSSASPGTTDPPEQPPKSEVSHAPSSGMSRKLQDVAALKGLKIDPINTETQAVQMSPTLPTPSSTYSQASMVSLASLGLSVPFIRHDISRLRPDRTRGLKKRVQDDLARERRISEEDETTPVSLDYADRPLPPVPSLEHQRSIDQLDQFPSVPSSRPPSRASVGGKRLSTQSQSRSRSHARHSSKGSSIRPKRARQMLGTSEIKVLVNTSPVIELSHTGTQSLDSGVADGSGTKSRVKPCHDIFTNKPNLSYIGKDSDCSRAVSTKKPSLCSLRSQASSRPSTSIARPVRGATVEPATDSEDDMLPQFTSTRINSAGVKKLRRRWNSNDIQAMHRIQEDLAYNHDIIMRLEQELRLQREEIQKTVRVFAPISHAKGLKGAKYNALQPSFVMDKNTTKAERVLAKELESINAARDRSPKAKKAKDTSAKLRPVSHISSASATTNMTMGSDERISVEGSMTDPHEYDLPSSENALAALSPTTNGNASSSRPRSQGSMTALHHPPPVAKVLPKGKLAEEEGSTKSTQPEPNIEGDDDEERLNVNHGFTDTEQMDRAIEALKIFA